MRVGGREASIEVLHVDDEESFLDLVATFLGREDPSLTVRSATTPAEAVETFERESIDCVVSDFDMPGQTGLDLLETIRDRDDAVPFFLFTGKGSEEIASRAISAGVTDYIQKSAGTDQYTILANRISNAVERDRTETEMERTRRFFRKLIEHSTDVIPVIEPDGTIAYLSESAEVILGYDAEEVIGENAFEYIHPDDVEAASRKFVETIENPDSMPEVEFRFRHADGSWVQLHGRARNLLEDPDVGGIVSYNRLVDG